jgi:hypothetical protein
VDRSSKNNRIIKWIKQVGHNYLLSTFRLCSMDIICREQRGIQCSVHNSVKEEDIEEEPSDVLKEEEGDNLEDIDIDRIGTPE